MKVISEEMSNTGNTGKVVITHQHIWNIQSTISDYAMLINQNQKSKIDQVQILAGNGCSFEIAKRALWLCGGNIDLAVLCVLKVINPS